MTQKTAFPTLTGHQYMSLTTFRKNGEPVPTPVWFAEQGGKIYVFTQGSSGKVKRIRNNGKVTLAPCKANGDVLGDAVPATAQIIEDRVREAMANRALRDKYKMLYQIFRVFGEVSSRIRGRRPHVAYLEISPS